MDWLTANFFKWSINTCKLTSSVKIGAEDTACWFQPYCGPLLCVVDGFTFDNKNLA